MWNYEGAQCPHCGKELQQTDDIVVCPDCGTPQHRSCWQQHGECGNAAKHAEGFVWSKPVLPAAAEEEPEITCPRCGRANNAANIFCAFCGSELNRSADTQSSQFPGLAAFTQQQQQIPDETYEDIPASDWQLYIGPNSYSYFRHFEIQRQRNSKISFAVIPAIFPDLYFLYRKAWVTGIILGVLMVVLSLPAMFSLYFEYFGLSSVLGLSYEFWLKAMSWSSYAVLAVRLVCSLLGIWIYRKESARRMRKIKAQSLNDSDYRQKLVRRGGTSWVGILIYCAACFSLSYIASHFILL